MKLIMFKVARALLNKSPLLDGFKRHHNYLRISLTERCNLRCLYCMPEGGVDLTEQSKLLTTKEILDLASLFVRLGVTKIKLTGGEPSIRKDIIDIVRELNKLKKHGLMEIGITSNGIKLRKQIGKLLEHGLDSVNLSLDTLDEHQFALLTRRNGFSKVIECINLATSLNTKLKINCVVMRKINENQLCDFIELTKNNKLGVRFIEYMPFQDNKWNENKLVTYREMLETINKKYENKFYKLKDKQNDTAKRYKVFGYLGDFGFISSMSQNFCSGCNRIRITADGHLKNCLFTNKEIDLKPYLRENRIEEMLEHIRSYMKSKKKEHSNAEELKNSVLRPMIKIGG